MTEKKPNRRYAITLFVFLAVVLGVIFGPKLLYGAVLESHIEGKSESALKRYAEQVGQRLRENPAGDSWRSVTGAGVLKARRPDTSTLVISTDVTVVADLFFGNSLVVRCYDITFTDIGTPHQRYDLDKISGCEPERRGPAMTSPP
ncbi:hypothetical protein [Nonomuraea sp. NPDC049695]|uniref:hypothetical protein n=1 Tax=Nonomuraea sp. NPDC049695 TaxID=3154734 RepID=UPI003431EA36